MMDKSIEQNEQRKQIIPVYDTVILPDVRYNLVPNLLAENEIATLTESSTVVILPLKGLKNRKKLRAEDFYEIGVAGIIKAVDDSKDGFIISVETIERIQVSKLYVDEDSMYASFIKRADEIDLTDEEIEQTLTALKETMIEVTMQFQWGPLVARYAQRWSNINEIISTSGPYMELTAEEKYQLLRVDSLKERQRLIVDAVMTFQSMLNLQIDISKKMKDTQNNSYKQAAILKQMELLQQELDEMNPENVSDEALFKKKIEEAAMPENVKKEVDRVFRRFKQEGKTGHEYSTLYDYLDFVTDLKWVNEKAKHINIAEAKKILDQDHYGLRKVKERVLEHIAVMLLNQKQSGSILLFVGAPGTGKTSMGKSIAEALGRKYVRISLGGVKDESEIRGHRRTYVGAMPGRIMEGMKRAGAMNPVMVLDEIDKLSSSYNGDPASALLEVLDPEQNDTFTDHYMNVPYDLSNVLFVCTANSLDTVPGPLLDRMEVIPLSGYTPIEKYHIAKKHLIPQALERTGIKKGSISFSDQTLRGIIEHYTRESGVRGLKKQLEKLCRYAAVKFVEGSRKKVVIREADLKKIFEKKFSGHDKILKADIPGIATGLAWTPVGGDILFIETSASHGRGKIHITGKLGDVMKESAEIAVSLVKSIFYEEKLDFKDKDLHIHVPSGAVPKDGPSAGVTLLTALTSLVTGIPVNRELAMTGEISLRGEVLPIGGLPEKLMAAERAGIKTVLIPFENEEDLREVPEEIKRELNIIPVKTIEEVIDLALTIKLPNYKKSLFFENFDEFRFAIPTVSKGKLPRVRL